MTVKRDHMSKADAVTIAAIQAGAPSLAEAHALIERFHAMIRKKEADQLDPWIAEARDSLVSSFATGVANDKFAVRAAITEPWAAPVGKIGRSAAEDELASMAQLDQLGQKQSAEELAQHPDGTVTLSIQECEERMPGRNFKRPRPHRATCSSPRRGRRDAFEMT